MTALILITAGFASGVCVAWLAGVCAEIRRGELGR